MVLANVTPVGGYQGGSIVKYAAYVGGGPSVDRVTVQVNGGGLPVNSLAITLDGEVRVSDHRRARGEGNSGVDNGNGPGLRVMESRGREGGGQRRRGGGVRRGGTRRIIGDTLWENLDGNYGPGSILIIVSGRGIRRCHWGGGVRASILETDAAIREILEDWGGK